MVSTRTEQKNRLSLKIPNFKYFFRLSVGVFGACLAVNGIAREISDSPRPASLDPLPPRVCKKMSLIDRISKHSWMFNSGNPAKQQHFQELFQKSGMTPPKFLKTDVKEIDASHTEVVVHKASSMLADWVLVEDSALDIEGENIGIHIKWHVHKMKQWISKTAKFTAKLAYKVDGIVYVFSGEVTGKIVSPRGKTKKGAEFDPYFLPDGSEKTMAEGVDEQFSARAIAMRKLVNSQVDLCTEPIIRWEGPWQQS